MRNQDIAIALNYHNQTKHSYHSVRSSSHYLDWDNRPLPFKIYSTLPALQLPKDNAPLPMSALAAILAGGEASPGAHVPDLAMLARLLFLSNGVHRVRRYGGSEYAFRTASCTGALYHIELYLVCGDLPGLSAGVYHYGAHDHALRRLREGDHRGVAVQAAANEAALAQAPAIIVCTDTFWRNSWKYQAREYRHTYWDNGVILANLLATAAAFDLPARVVCGFADEVVNRLLSLDTSGEVAVSLVALGRDPVPSPVPRGESEMRWMAPLDLPTAALSNHEVDYPIIREVHAASGLTVDEVAPWRGAPPSPKPKPPAAGALFPLLPLSELPHDSLDAVILRRGSTRVFAQEPITFAQLSSLLIACSRGVPADFLEPFGATLNDWYLIINAVEDLPAGTCFYRGAGRVLEQLRAGNLRERAGYLDLGQELGRDAAINIYFFADLGTTLQRFGNRGYRAAELEAGILGGKLYLAAYALGMGATGLTFYDDDVSNFFSPHAEGKSVMFLMAVGVPNKMRT